MKRNCTGRKMGLKRWTGGFLGAALLACTASAGEDVRTWTHVSGQTVEGRYVSSGIDKITIIDGNGLKIALPTDQLSQPDLAYLELINPPTLNIDFLESAQTREFIADPWYAADGGGPMMNDPVYIIDGRFGARIRKTSMKPYNHKLTVTLMVFTRQALDREKFHMIVRTTSKPFALTKENHFSHKFHDPRSHQILYYNLSGNWPRGEKLGEYLILVRDERGEVIAHRESGNWLFDHYENLLALPLGSWVDDSGQETYPTTPKRDTGNI